MSPPPIEEVLPHRGSMLLVDRVLAWDGQRVSVSSLPRADAWYADAQGMPSWIGIELMAQAMAAHVGLMARSRQEPPKQGLLLGTRAYRATLPHFPFGRRLTVRAQRAVGDDSGIGAYDCAIELGGDVVRTALL